MGSAHPPGKHGIITVIVPEPVANNPAQGTHVGCGPLCIHPGIVTGSVGQLGSQQLGLLGDPSQEVCRGTRIRLLHVAASLLQQFQLASVGHQFRDRRCRGGLQLEDLQLESESVAQEDVVHLAFHIQVIKICLRQGCLPVPEELDHPAASHRRKRDIVSPSEGREILPVAEDDTAKVTLGPVEFRDRIQIGHRFQGLLCRDSGRECQEQGEKRQEGQARQSRHSGLVWVHRNVVARAPACRGQPSSRIRVSARSPVRQFGRVKRKPARGYPTRRYSGSRRSHDVLHARNPRVPDRTRR